MADPVADGGRVEIVLIYQSLLGIYGDRGNAERADEAPGVARLLPGAHRRRAG